jgi:hypothetical protein
VDRHIGTVYYRSILYTETNTRTRLVSPLTYETALHNMVTRTESAIRYKAIAPGEFLDTNGAFDRTPFDVLTQAAGKAWYWARHFHVISSMLESWNIITTPWVETIRTSTASGCQQRDVISPLLWTLVGWSSLDHDYYTVWCADDIAILINGNADHSGRAV